MSLQEPRICIIDDNVAVCESLKFLLDSLYSITINIYHNPLLFLQEFSKDWQGCLIIDLFMPSLNGIDLVKELKIRDNKMSIIIISGHGTANAAEQSLRAGASMFIKKPFKMDLLIEKLNTILQFNNSPSMPAS